eukprot:scaffold19606_cov84-Isochrysis_galbana.AAC.3
MSNVTPPSRKPKRRTVPYRESSDKVSEREARLPRPVHATGAEDQHAAQGGRQHAGQAGQIGGGRLRTESGGVPQTRGSW